MAIVQQVLSIG